MATRRRKRKVSFKARKTTKRKKASKKRGGHVPLAILKRRLTKLSAIVKKRGG